MIQKCTVFLPPCAPWMPASLMWQSVKAPLSGIYTVLMQLRTGFQGGKRTSAAWHYHALPLWIQKLQSTMRTLLALVVSFSQTLLYRRLNITNNFPCPLGKKAHTFSLNSTRLTRNTVKINSLYGPLTECLYQWGLTVYVRGTTMKLIILPQASRIHVYALQIKHETKLAWYWPSIF